MVIRFGEVAVNTDTVSFVSLKGENCEIHFIGGESVVVPEKDTAGYFSGAPTIQQLMKLHDEQARAASSGIVKPNVIVR